MKKLYYVDRIEEGSVVVETDEKAQLTMSLDDIIGDVLEGDVLEVCSLSPLKYKVSKKETCSRKQEIKKLIDELWE